MGARGRCAHRGRTAPGGASLRPTHGCGFPWSTPVCGSSVGEECEGREMIDEDEALVALRVGRGRPVPTPIPKPTARLAGW